MLDKKQKKIRNVALKLFHENGYAETTVRDIAKKLKINAPSLYSSMDSKDDILVWICDEIENCFREIMIEVSQFEGTDEDRFTYLIKTHITQVLAHKAEFETSWNYWHIANAYQNGKYDAIMAQYFNFIKDIVYKVIPEDQGSHFIKDAFIFALVQIINHVPKSAAESNGKYDVECIASTISKRILYGFHQ